MKSNMDNYQTTIPNCADSMPNKCSCPSIDDSPKVRSHEQTPEACKKLKNACRPGNCSSLESEICDLSVQSNYLQATIDDMVKSNDVIYKSLAQDFFALSRVYEKTSTKMVERQTENSKLQNTLCCKMDVEVQKAKEIKQLECAILNITDCIKTYVNQNHNEQIVLNSLEEQLKCLDQSNARRKVQADRLRCEAETVKNTLCSKKAELQELRDRNVERCRMVKELMAENREREAALATLKESGPVVLASATQSVDAARMALADACDAAADWEAMRVQADEASDQARTDGDANRCRAQAALRDLTEELGRLVNQLTDTGAQLAVAKNNRRLLAANTKANADRIACLRAEMERSKQRVHHKRSVQAVQQANVEAETKSIEDRRTADSRLLEMANSEVEALKQASRRHECAIKSAKQELQEQCSMKAC